MTVQKQTSGERSLVTTVLEKRIVLTIRAAAPERSIYSHLACGIILTFILVNRVSFFAGHIVSVDGFCFFTDRPFSCHSAFAVSISISNLTYYQFTHLI